MVNHNSYFDAQVQSLGSTNADGRFTVGVMAPGEWTFAAGAAEIMQLVRGTWDVQQPAGQGDFTTYEAGTSFDVPENTDFTVRIAEAVAYLCLYADEQQA